MEAINNKLILKKADYDLLVKFVFSSMSPMSADNKSAEQLYEELKNAEIYHAAGDIPNDVVRVNSVVDVFEETTGQGHKFRIVMPEEANLRKQKLSIFAPMGIALVGYRKGQKVHWQMPSGDRIFYIRDVINDMVH